jgi:hypothetical protein
VSEIQRYGYYETYRRAISGVCNAHTFSGVRESSNGDYVKHSDHLAAVKAARIEALKEAVWILADYHDKNKMGVTAIIQSDWAHGVFSGRGESVNVLNRRIAAIEQEEPRCAKS